MSENLKFEEEEAQIQFQGNHSNSKVARRNNLVELLIQYHVVKSSRGAYALLLTFCIIFVALAIGVVVWSSLITSTPSPKAGNVNSDIIKIPFPHENTQTQ